ncbi:hypothetical protein EON63_18705 [archaeon]|nr:MAG: hypothetical protein EON63_18705 [archaeon]
MPASPSSNGNFWYSFVYGNVRWISLSSEHPLDANSEQIAFLTSTLQQAQAERKTTPWIIFTLHKPLYCSVEGSPHFADELEALLLQYDVDLTLTGHMHAYERIHPVKAGEVTVNPKKLPWGASVEGDEDGKEEAKMLGKIGLVDVYYSSGYGPVHVMQGHAGGMQVERWTYPIPAWSGFRMANGIVMPGVNYTYPYGDDIVYDLSDHSKQLPEDLETLSLFPLKIPGDLLNGNYNYSHTYGFGYITAFNHTHLLYQAIPNVDGERNHDEFWIVKKH